MFIVSCNWLFTTWLEETLSETSVQVIGSHSRIRHGKVAVQFNSIWHCKLTSKKIWGKLSEQTDWFKAKDSLKAEIKGTFRGPWATLHNILLTVVGVKRNATANHIIMVKPISQWRDAVMMLSLHRYSHISSYRVVYCRIQLSLIVFYPEDNGSKPWHTAELEFHLHYPLCRCYIYSRLSFLTPSTVKRATLRQVYIMHCNLISQTLVSVKQLESR